MKNNKSGFIVPLLVVAILLVSGGYYFYFTTNRVEDKSENLNSNIRENKSENNVVSEPENKKITTPIIVENKKTPITSVKPTIKIQDINSLSIEELWSIYTEPSKYDAQIVGSASKGISARLGQSAKGSAEIQVEFAKRLLNESGNIGERISLARVLGESGTSEALATLTRAIFTTKDSELFRSIIEQLSRMGRAKSSQQAAQMTFEIKKGWEAVATYEDSKRNLSLYYPFGGILAKLGDPDSVRFLRSEAVRGGSTISELKSSNNIPATVAMEASNGVKGLSSISILTDSLLLNDPTLTEFVWSGQALSSTGYKEGASALVEWAKTAPDSCAPLVEKWLSGLRDSHAHAYMKEINTIGKSIEFKSPVVKDAVLKVASKYAESE